MTRFRVDIENQPRRIFNSAAEALVYGARHVYLRPSETPKMLERLVGNEPVAWAYGFVSVEIAPLDPLLDEELVPAGSKRAHATMKSTSLIVTDADIKRVMKSLDPKRDVYLINIARIALGLAPDPSWQGECGQALARQRIAAHIKVHQAMSGDPTYPRGQGH